MRLSCFPIRTRTLISDFRLPTSDFRLDLLLSNFYFLLSLGCSPVRFVAAVYQSRRSRIKADDRRSNRMLPRFGFVAAVYQSRRSRPKADDRRSNRMLPGSLCSGGLRPSLESPTASPTCSQLSTLNPQLRKGAWLPRSFYALNFSAI